MNRVFIILVMLATAQCSRKTSTTIPASGGPPPSGAVKTWLALGDSYTIGQSVTAAERFPAQTANLLKQQGINIGEPDYIARTGWTTTDLKFGISAENPVPHDVVSLLIGVNDQYQWHDTTGYRQRFKELLTKAVELAGGKKENVFVLSIPDYSVTPFASLSDTARIRKEIDWFNAINSEVTAAFQCPYLNITFSTREALTNSSLLAGDGLHPSGAEYKKWAERLSPMVKPVLQ